MNASEHIALEVGLQGPLGLHSECELCETARSAVVSTAIQPFGSYRAEFIRASTFLTYAQSRNRLLVEAAMSCCRRGRFSSDSLLARSIKLPPTTEPRAPPHFLSDQIHIVQAKCVSANTKTTD